jgi:ABC-type phosphate transport system permease subunit
MRKYFLGISFVYWTMDALAYVSPSVRKSAGFMDVFLSSVILLTIIYILSFGIRIIMGVLMRVFNPQLWKDSKKVIKNTTNQEKKHD